VELSGNGPGLVTFAVPEESRPFLRAWGRATASKPTRCGPSLWRFPDFDVLVTGMGSRNAQRGIENLLQDRHPRWVITAGFAGGLDPGCPHGTVGLSSDPDFIDSGVSKRLGLLPMTFHESLRVIPTPQAKAELRRRSGCQAVDMESATIRRACHVRGIPSATIRVISDDAGEALPLDFGALMGPDDRMDWTRFALTLLGSPSLIPGLIRFQRRLSRCSEDLAGGLVAIARHLRTGPVPAGH
jgi:adenosylhomocysteine nucleosidase